MTYKPPKGTLIKNVPKSRLKVIAPGGSLSQPSDPKAALESDMDQENVFDPRVKSPTSTDPGQPPQPPEQPTSPGRGGAGGKGERRMDKEGEVKSGSSPTDDPGTATPGEKPDPGTAPGSGGEKPGSEGDKPGQDIGSGGGADPGAGKTPPGDDTGDGVPVPDQDTSGDGGVPQGVPQGGFPQGGKPQGGKPQGGKPQGGMSKSMTNIRKILSGLKGLEVDPNTGVEGGDDSVDSAGETPGERIEDAPSDSGLDGVIGEAVDAAAKQLEKQKADANVPPEQKTSSMPTASDLVKSMGAGNIEDAANYVRGLRNSKLNDDWRSMIKRLLKKAVGVTEEYSSVTPSRRIEGQFGREIEKPAIRRVVLSVDCSGSMGPEMFRQVFTEMKKLSSNSIIKRHMKKSEIWSFTWGSFSNERTPEARRKVAKENLVRLPGRGFTENIVGQMVSQDLSRSANGGTDFIGFHAAMLKVAAKPDLVIVMTDGDFWSETAPGEEVAVKRLLSRLSKTGRLIWVLVGSRKKSEIRRLDPKFKSHTIEIKSSAK